MTKDKKVVKSTAKKAEPKVVPKPVVKDSTEIDDLFSTLSSAKKAKNGFTEVTMTAKDAVKKTEKKKKKERSKDETEVTLSDLEDLKDEEDFVDSEEDSEDLIKGTAYDPKNDDIFPATTIPTTSIAIDSDFFDSRGLKRKTRALTEDGYPIYTPSELKIGMGGGTDLCPFDCNCCF